MSLKKQMVKYKKRRDKIKKQVNKLYEQYNEVKNEINFLEDEINKISTKDLTIVENAADLKTANVLLDNAESALEIIETKIAKKVLMFNAMDKVLDECLQNLEREKEQ